MTCRVGMFFTPRADFSSTSWRPGAVVAVSSLPPMSLAVGPSSKLPWTVGDTSTPLPYLPGSWNTVRLTWPPAVWSSRQYSPRRGVMCSLSSQTQLWISSANTPAALTTARAAKSPWLVWTIQPSPARSRPVTWVSKENSTPFLAALSARPKVSSKGHTMPEVLASRAPCTSSERLGSKARACSPVSSSMSGTPVATPRS